MVRVVAPPVFGVVLLLLLLPIGSGSASGLGVVADKQSVVTLFSHPQGGLDYSLMTAAIPTALEHRQHIAPAAFSSSCAGGVSVTPLVGRAYHEWDLFTDSGIMAYEGDEAKHTMFRGLGHAIALDPETPSMLTWWMYVQAGSSMLDASTPAIVPDFILDLEIRADASLRADASSHDDGELLAAATVGPATLAREQSTGPVHYESAHGKDLYRFDLPIIWQHHNITTDGFIARLRGGIDAPCDGQTMPPVIGAWSDAERRSSLVLGVTDPIRFESVQIQVNESSVAPDSYSLNVTATPSSPFGVSDIDWNSVQANLTGPDGSQSVPAEQGRNYVYHGEAPSRHAAFTFEDIPRGLYTLHIVAKTHAGATSTFQTDLDLERGEVTACAPLPDGGCAPVLQQVLAPSQETPAAPLALALIVLLAVVLVGRRRQ